MRESHITRVGRWLRMQPKSPTEVIGSGRRGGCSRPRHRGRARRRRGSDLHGVPGTRSTMHPLLVPCLVLFMQGWISRTWFVEVGLNSAKKHVNILAKNGDGAFRSCALFFFVGFGINVSDALLKRNGSAENVSKVFAIRRCRVSIRTTILVDFSPQVD